MGTKKTQMRSKSVVVMGLGTFGVQIAKTLYQGGVNILALDMEQAKVDRMAAWCSKAVCADIRDYDVLKAHGVFDMDIAIIALRQHFDTSVLITNALNKAGVKKIIVQVDTDQEADAIKSVGATHPVFPQRDMAIRIANQLISPSLTDFLSISANISIIEEPVPDKFVGESLIKLNLRRKYGLTVLAIKMENQDGEHVEVNPNPEAPLEAGNSLLLLGENRHLDIFKKEFSAL